MSRRARAARTSRIQVLQGALFVIGSGIVGCDGFGTSPTPTSTTTTIPSIAPVLAVFSDPNSSFMTSDVRDVQNQIVRFDTANRTLIWAADNRSFQGYPVSGNFIGADRNLQVRFGTEGGERRAYFTETASATICNIEVNGGQLVINPTSAPVPGE